METATMGDVRVNALIENYGDVIDAEEGRIPRDGIRRIEVEDALVETRVSYVSMPLRLINQLGLKRIKSIEGKTVMGPFSFGIYELVRLTIQGRDCEIRVAEVADDGPVLIGRLPLVQLDFVVDPENQ